MTAWMPLLSIPVERTLSASLGAPDWQLSHDNVSWLHRSLDPEILKSVVERDTFPIPATVDREGYHGDRHLDYWLSGYLDFCQLRQTFETYSGRRLSDATVFDWGCASGRVLRHFAYQTEDVRCFGVDVKHAHCRWIRENLDRKVVAVPVTILPTLPFPDRQFDLVYGFSVLTHIGEFDTTWISELSRITKSDGLICVTILGDSAWKKMRPGFIPYDAMDRIKEHFDEPFDFSPDFFENTPLTRFYIEWSRLHPVYNCTGFHSHDYIRKHWGSIADIVAIIPEAHEYQDLVVLRPKGHRRNTPA